MAEKARGSEREALIVRLEGAKALFHEFYSTGVAPLSLDFDPAYEAIEDAVRALRASDRPEPEWQYAVRHVAVDGWPTFRIHPSEESARADFATCGMHCALTRRTSAGRGEPGPWVPVGEGEQS